MATRRGAITLLQCLFLMVNILVVNGTDPPTSSAEAPASGAGAPASSTGASSAGAPASSAGASSPPGSPMVGTPFDITTFGAVADGKTDIMQAFLKAWVKACASPTPATIVVPEGNFLCGLAVVSGPCRSAIGVQVIGTISSQDSIPGDNWFVFKHVDNFALFGTGMFDGKGAGKVAPNAANLRFQSVNNGIITGITSKDSNFFHMSTLESKNLTFTKLTILAPAESVNTDGIHLSDSSDVKIIDVDIQTGDDCISMVDGVTNVHVEGVRCGPGHGISIGSLGKYANEKPVAGIFVKNCTLKETDNGVRIKSWPAQEEGAATDIHFEDITLENVENPIIIDQEYCPNGQCKSKGPSKVKISNISFKNIHGTSKNPEAIIIKCSSLNPCDQVQLTDIDITCPAGGAVKSECLNVKPIVSGKPLPPGCA
ncbi:G9 [Linum grandiflorum]